MATLVVAITGAAVATGYALDSMERADALERASYVSGIAAASSAVREQEFATAATWLDRVPDENHYQDWITACKTGTPSCADFSYAGPFTEMVNFGNLVVKSGKKLKWDNTKGVVTNVKNASEIVSKEYRKGWELPV